MQSPYLLLTLVSLVSIAMISVSCAAIPNLSPAELQELADEIVVGKVQTVYSAPQTPDGDYQEILHLIEMRVEKREKGDKSKTDKLVYVRTWSKKFVGKGFPAPGHYGISDLPKPGTKLRAYVSQAEDGGADALQPNGLNPIK